MAQRSTNAIREFEFPRNLTQSRLFLEPCKVYKKFVKDFAKIVRPLTKMIRKASHPNSEAPTKEQRHAFEALKLRLITLPVSPLPKAGNLYLIDTHASAHQSRATVLQLQNDKSRRPVGYGSYSLNNTERNYAATKQDYYGPT